MKTKLLGLVLVATGAANAAIMIDAGNDPQPPEFNVLLTNVGHGTTVNGTFNEFPGLNAVFTSTQTLDRGCQRPGRISAMSRRSRLTSRFPFQVGNTFDDIIFALNPPNGGAPNASYNITANGTLQPSPRPERLRRGISFLLLSGNGKS